MTGNDSKERLLIAGATIALQDARRLLIAPTPEALDECLFPLERAAENLTLLHKRALLASGGVPTAELMREMEVIKALLQSAAAFHLEWAGRHGFPMVGYRADGSTQDAGWSGQQVVVDT